MSVQNLWGDLPEVGAQKTPAQILREQADLLTQMSRGAVQGKVEPMAPAEVNGYELGYRLNIVASALNFYSVSILEVTHPVTLYPVYVRSELDPTYRRQAPDEESFVSALRKVLSSLEVRKVLSALILQTNSSATPANRE